MFPFGGEFYQSNIVKVGGYFYIYTVHGSLLQRRIYKNFALEPTPPKSRSNVNNRSPRRFTAEEVIDLFQSLEDKKNEIDVDYESDQSRSIAILIDLSQNLILRMNGRCPNKDLNLQRDDTK